MCLLCVCTSELPTTLEQPQTQERESTSCHREPKIIPLLWTDRLFCNLWIQTKSYLCKRRTNLCYSDCEKPIIQFFLSEDGRYVRNGSWALKPVCGCTFDWLLHIHKTVNKMIKCKQACASEAYKPRTKRILWATEWKNKDYSINSLIRTSLKLIETMICCMNNESNDWFTIPARRLQLACC